MIASKKIQGVIIIGILLLAFLYFDANSVDGEYIFKREGCDSCHKFKGQGGLAGPDLTSAAETRSDRWLRDQIKNPVKNNPDTRMPDYRHLSRKEINALIKYLKS
jgi:cbb3-type cytochrome oxidase cytochrome c subunit